MTRGRSWLSILILPILLLAGCGGGGAPVRYYLVDPVDYAGDAVMGARDLSIEIIEVHVPQYLERFHIATRGEANRLRFSDNNQWGENLRKNLLRTLARNLSMLLGTTDVGTPLNRSLSAPDYRVQVHIEQFERDADGRVKLSAWWQLGASGQAPVGTYKAAFQSPAGIAGDDYDGIVAAMQDLYGQLSLRVAESIRSARMGGAGQAGR